MSVCLYLAKIISGARNYGFRLIWSTKYSLNTNWQAIVQLYLIFIFLFLFIHPSIRFPTPLNPHSGRGAAGSYPSFLFIFWKFSICAHTCVWPLHWPKETWWLHAHFLLLKWNESKISRANEKGFFFLLNGDKTDGWWIIHSSSMTHHVIGFHPFFFTAAK